MNVCILLMLYFDQINVSEGIDVNEENVIFAIICIS